MSTYPITCPKCLTPAAKWFEFGGKSDPHSYYHCDTCGRSCAVQHQHAGRRTPWVRMGGAPPSLAGFGERQSAPESDEPVTVRTKQDRRRQIRIPTQHVAKRAYELHEQRGGLHGHDLDDWLRAERDLVRVYAPHLTIGSGAES